MDGSVNKLVMVFAGFSIYRGSVTSPVPGKAHLHVNNILPEINLEFFHFYYMHENNQNDTEHKLEINTILGLQDRYGHFYVPRHLAFV